MIKRMLPSLCILLGMLIFLYPTLNDRYESYRQEQLMRQWTETMKRIDQGPGSPDTRQTVTPVPISAITAPPSAEVPPEEQQQQPLTPEPTSAPDPLRNKKLEGVLSIDKIKLKLPIITDATTANLKLSVASIAGTGQPGAVGNYAIAGHRSLTYGKNFNRLDEVEQGDVIEVDTGQQQYRYEVYEKLYVLPEDVWVLKGNGKDRDITLITCHPIDTGTHRIIVKGRLVEK
ncbi:class D sortase [Paenibacillus sp. H1-7]|uniref:class D sortase n=1 Tax=Paenibacillus sp. H1-7 TaxID=2282849 RepID=UPI001EF9467E|nr:class D sortase [Paenibacillus sp. H1-7]ULL19245.1 class D sortase [Paenibacillus sp. H1-7]